MQGGSELLSHFRERYCHELFDSVVPFWLRHSPDEDFGGYFTCLDREGRIYDTRKYVPLQGGAVWILARLYNTVECRPEWLEAARTGAEFLERNAFDPGGRCYSSLTREGQPVHFQRRPHAAAFVALGFLEYARASGDKTYLEHAVGLFWRIRSWIEFPGMLGRPVLNGGAPASRLADIVVSATLALGLHDALGDRRYSQVLTDSVDDALRHLEPDRGILLEQVAPNGAKRFDTPEGRLFSPGLSIQMAWLLLEILRRFPNPANEARALAALEGSLEFGWDHDHSGLFWYMDVDGRPPLAPESDMKLWWPHAEAIRAVVLAGTLTGEKKWLDWLGKLDEYAFAHFADTDRGEWFGYCDRYGRLANTCKGNNSKGMFHLARALLESIEAIDRGVAGGTGDAAGVA